MGNMKTNKLQQITYGLSIDTEPRFSPDGQSLVFTSARGGQPQIYQYFFRDKKSKRLTFVGRFNARPSLTSDGEHLVMMHRGKDGVFQIASQNLKTGVVRILTRAEHDESPTLSPNDTLILYGSQIKGQHVLAAVSLDGRVKLRLPSRIGMVQEPAWSPFIS